MNENIKISDYLLPTKILQILCQRFDSDFIDYPIEFVKDGDIGFQNSCFYLQENMSLPKVFWSIISLYINNIEVISGNYLSEDDIMAASNYALALIRDFTFRDKMSHFDGGSSGSGAIAMKLDQFPLSWMLMKNIISPYKRVKLKNTSIIADSSCYVDAALYVNKDSVGLDMKDKDILPFIFVNKDIASKSIQEAFVFTEALRSHGLDPEQVIRDVFGNFYIRKKILGLLSMAFIEDEDVANFVAILSIISESEDLESLAISLCQDGTIEKIAQSQSLGGELGDVSTGNWWFLGLTEKMLEQFRGDNWEAHEILKTLSDDLWTKVEKRRKKNNLSEVPFEMLLRIQSEEYGNDKEKILQGLLADTRVW